MNIFEYREEANMNENSTQEEALSIKDLTIYPKSQTPLDPELRGLGAPEIKIQPLQFSKFSKWNIIGASVQGTAHIKSNLPCQDAHNYKIVQDLAVILAVADGLGSALKSHEGARLATNIAVATIESTITENIPVDEESWIQVIRNSFSQTQSKLKAYAEENNTSLREYGTTLIVVVVTDEFLAIGHIGDGSAVALFEDESLVTICPPQKTEYINQVAPLTLPNALEIARFSVQKTKIKSLAIFSDGIQHLSINNLDHTPYVGFFIPLFNQISMIEDSYAASQSLADFLASERVCSKTDDDKTLILIGRKTKV